MSALLTSRPVATTINVRQRTQNLLSPLNLHIAGVALLSAINLYLLVHMLFLWQQASSRNADALARQQVALRAAEIATEPLHGLDAKLASTSSTADAFYLDRLPATYSRVATELGAVARLDGVRLTRGNYTQAAVAGEAAGELTEVRMDYSVGGDYRGLVRFINDLERDRLFFLISGVTLTGQQSGTVGLRIRITTYLRGLPGEADTQKAAVVPDAAVLPAGTTFTPSLGGAR